MANQEAGFTFSDDRIKDLDPPTEKARAYYVDTGPRSGGLRLCVTRKGSKSFHIRVWRDGRSNRVFIGKCKAMGVTVARKKAVFLTAAHEAGEDVQSRSLEIRHGGTCNEMFDEFERLHGKPHKKSWKQDRAIYDLHIGPRFGHRNITRIGHHEILTWHVELGESAGHVCANRSLARFKSMFSKAITWGKIHHGKNPCKGVPLFPETSRERFLQVEEMPAFMAALDADAAKHGTTWKHLLLVAIFTGARKANLLSMRWEDLDTERRVWTIPAAAVKGGRGYTVPLVEPAVAVLEARRLVVDIDCEWVFPSEQSETGHITQVKGAWKRITDAAKIKNLRFHDLRRTFASWLTIGGAPLPLVGTALGHRPGSPATSVYSRLSSDAVRTAFETTATALLEAGEQNERQK